MALRSLTAELGFMAPNLVTYMPKYKCFSLQHIFVCLCRSLKFDWNIPVDANSSVFSREAYRQRATEKSLFSNPGLVSACWKVLQPVLGYCSSALNEDFYDTFLLMGVGF